MLKILISLSNFNQKDKQKDVRMFKEVRLFFLKDSSKFVKLYRERESTLFLKTILFISVRYSTGVEFQREKNDRSRR